MLTSQIYYFTNIIHECKCFILYTVVTRLRPENKNICLKEFKNMSKKVEILEEPLTTKKQKY